MVFQFGAVDILKFNIFCNELLTGCIQVQLVFKNIVHTLKALSHIDGPAQGTYIDLKLLFDLVQQIEGILSVAVQLVYKNNNRCFTHTAYLHQFSGLSLHPFGDVDHYNNTIHRRKGTECIFGKVLVTRSIENVDFIVVVIESHHGSSNRDSTLLFNLHPVGCSGFLDLV